MRAQLREVGLLLFSVACFAAELEAKIPTTNLFNWLETEKINNKKYYEFNKLKFAYDPSSMSCKLLNLDNLLCSIKSLGSVSFQKKALSSKFALPLVRLARKQQWDQEFSLQNQYVESYVNSKLGVLVVQKLMTYRLDNILWPVLIRAFDVVIDNMCISVTTKCDFRDWPAFEKEISALEASLTKISGF